MKSPPEACLQVLTAPEGLTGFDSSAEVGDSLLYSRAATRIRSGVQVVGGSRWAMSGKRSGGGVSEQID